MSNVSILIQRLNEPHASALSEDEIAIFLKLSVGEIGELAEYINPNNQRTILHRLLQITSTQSEAFFKQFSSLILSMKAGIFNQKNVVETVEHRARLTFYFLQNPNDEFKGKILEIMAEKELSYIFRNKKGAGHYLSSAKDEQDYDARIRNLRHWNISIPMMNDPFRSAATSSTSSSTSSNSIHGLENTPHRVLSQSTAPSIPEFLRNTPIVRISPDTKKTSTFAQHSISNDKQGSFTGGDGGYEDRQLKIVQKQLRIAKEQATLAEERAQLTEDRLDNVERDNAALLEKNNNIEAQLEASNRKVAELIAQVRHEQEERHSIAERLKRSEIINEQTHTSLRVQNFNHVMDLQDRETQIEVALKDVKNIKLELEASQQDKAALEQMLQQARQDTEARDESEKNKQELAIATTKLSEVTTALQAQQQMVETLTQQLTEQKDETNSAYAKIDFLKDKHHEAHQEIIRLHKRRDEKMLELRQLRQSFDKIIDLSEEVENANTTGSSTAAMQLPPPPPPVLLPEVLSSEANSVSNGRVNNSPISSVNGSTTLGAGARELVGRSYGKPQRSDVELLISLGVWSDEQQRLIKDSNTETITSSATTSSATTSSATTSSATTSSATTGSATTNSNEENQNNKKPHMGKGKRTRSDEGHGTKARKLNTQTVVKPSLNPKEIFLDGDSLQSLLSPDDSADCSSSRRQRNFHG